MSWVEAAVWGLAGGFVVEGLDFYTAVRRHGKVPWKVTGPGPTAGVTAYVVAELVRLVIGGVVAAAVGASGQITGAMGGFAIGVAAPTVVERLAKLAPSHITSASGATTSEFATATNDDSVSVNTENCHPAIEPPRPSTFNPRAKPGRPTNEKR